ncbi:MAG: glycosyltransferase [Sulfuricellaceae bacterium]
MNSDEAPHNDILEKKPICYQVNLQRWFGGGEVYTGFFTRALHDLGWGTVIFVHPKATFWERLLPADTTLIRVASFDEIAKHLPASRSLLIFHTLAKKAQLDALQQNHIAACFAHMPQYGRDPTIYAPYRLIFGVSQHVIASLKAASMEQVYPQPLYGIASLQRGQTAPERQIVANSVYQWDRRKVRDLLLSYLFPFYARFKPKRIYERKPGLTLGIVSAITPIKQFPLLFRYLAPIIERFPQVNIEIFGSGGYASIFDLERSLAVISNQVRFWGQQRDIQTIYPQFDFLLAGLPEKEALGLNVIESQCCGTPVLAVLAPPFTETVKEGATGFFYTDPRKDNGEDFARLLKMLTEYTVYPDPLQASAHLEKFSYASFKERVQEAMRYALKESFT